MRPFIMIIVIFHIHIQFDRDILFLRNGLKLAGEAKQNILSEAWIELVDIRNKVDDVEETSSLENALFRFFLFIYKIEDNNYYYRQRELSSQSVLGVNRFARNTTLLLSTVALLDLYTFTETYICITDKLSPFFVCNCTIMYTSVRALERLNEFYNKQKCLSRSIMERDKLHCSFVYQYAYDDIGFIYMRLSLM